MPESTLPVQPVTSMIVHPVTRVKNGNMLIIVENKISLNDILHPLIKLFCVSSLLFIMWYNA